MKNRENHIEEKVQKTISSLEGINRATPRPFFYARVKERLYNSFDTVKEIPSFRPAYQWLIAVLLILFLAINFYTINSLNKSDQSAITPDLELFIDNYYPQSPSIYNLSQQVNQ